MGPPALQNLGLGQGVHAVIVAAGQDAEQIKKEIVGAGGSKYDLFKTGSGDIVVKLKSGAGEAQPTGLNIRNF